MKGMPSLEKIRSAAVSAISKAKNLADLKKAETHFLGKKGELVSVLRSLGSLPPKERPKIGAAANKVKVYLESLIQDRKRSLEEKAHSPETATSVLDLSEPGLPIPLGHLHPITQLQEELEDIFSTMGFSILDGPEVEVEKYNFDALNIPADHPARDMQDTFWCTSPTMLKDQRLLMRTHTSPVQVRGMERWVREKRPLPLRAIVPGRVFRNEALDASHDHTFWQMEGLVVGRDISVAHLLGTLRGFLRALFRKDIEIRLRPGYFPFVEPGFEMDARCPFCEKGCSVCKRTTWIELVPSGLVHPNVLRAGGFDPAKYSGFAFGLGLSRLAMLRYEIGDIRLFLSNDLRFLEQF